MNCDKCGKDCDELTKKPAYNGNKDTGWYCEDCYKEQHNEVAKAQRGFEDEE